MSCKLNKTVLSSLCFGTLLSVPGDAYRVGVRYSRHRIRILQNCAVHRLSFSF